MSLQVFTFNHTIEKIDMCDFAGIWKVAINNSSNPIRAISLMKLYAGLPAPPKLFFTIMNYLVFCVKINWS